MERDYTYNGLHKWYVRMFEKLGWMILADNYGDINRVKSYQKSLLKLVDALEKKIENTRDLDKQDDLKILHKNSKVLLEHVLVDFRNSIAKEWN